MSCLLPADCLNEVFEYLDCDNDKITLHSCLLVNRLWCKVSVRILWRSFKFLAYKHRYKVASSILSTLIACLPNKSKELLFKNEVFISTPTSKPPIFNYVAFCKFLSVNEFYQIIYYALKNDTTPQSLDDKICLVAKEIIQMFINQVSSLKRLTYFTYLNCDRMNNVSFTYVPGAKDCLTDLSELCCSSNIYSEFFYQLSQVCHNLQSLTVKFEKGVSNELKELISSQNNLKNLNLLAFGENSWTDITTSLAKHFDALTKLHLNGDNDNLPLSFVSSFSNLQEINLSFVNEIHERDFENFKELQYASFPKLQILKIYYQYTEPEYLTNFLEINGKNLKEFYTCLWYNNLNLYIAKFCPNLKKLFMILNSNELNVLETTFNSCQNLESIKIWCGSGFLNEKDVLEVVSKYSPKNFYELKIYNHSDYSNLFPEDLESFFTIWKNRTPKKSLCLIIIKSYDHDCISLGNEEIMTIIEKYKNLGIIKKFETQGLEVEECYWFEQCGLVDKLDW